ncbi:MAG: translation initiation factor IF-2 subunit gamma, partial [Candidatus Aenigmarchaeota archaeon]|nr:translation initiation factor IF-2 subunit gamma [Candidatus Aenigmarchaeota archaeon]
KWSPLKTKITSINKGKTLATEGTPGGLLALSTTLDPYIAKSDNLVGSVIGLHGKMPPVWNTLKLEMHLIEGINEKQEPVRAQEPILMGVGTARTIGVCTQPGNVSEFTLKIPVCADIGEKVALSRQVSGRFRLVGYGLIKK